MNSRHSSMYFVAIRDFVGILDDQKEFAAPSILPQAQYYSENVGTFENIFFSTHSVSFKT